MATFADYLRGVGRTHQLDGRLWLCSCGRSAAAESLTDVRSEPDVAGEFACGVCVSDLERRRIVAAESAEAAQTDGLTAEQLNAVRAERNRLLAATDWIELPSNRARVGEARFEAVMQFRAAARRAVEIAKATGEYPTFPPIPE